MILIAGSANADIVVRTQHIPTPGETVLGQDVKVFPGGKGANQAVAAARCHPRGEVKMLLALGHDDNAAFLRESLLSSEVKMLIKETTEPSGCALIVVADNAENTIVVAPGANNALLPQDWYDGIVTTGDYCLLQLETPLPSVEHFAQQARKAGALVILNAAPAPSLPLSFLQHIDVLVVNQVELAQLSGGAGSIAQQLQNVAVSKVLVTLGAAGVCAYWDGQWLLQPAFKIQPIDTTGAGDTFCGAFTAALDQGQDVGEALCFASAASALACTRMGAQSSIPSYDEVKALLTQQANTAANTATLRALCGL